MEHTMNSNIENALRKIHPDATSIEKNEHGLWDVSIVELDGYFEEIHTYALEGRRLVHVGSTEIQA
jgi:hypothetical protein